MTKRYYNLVLLERVRDEIQHTKKLNYHLYMSLKKALYKPGAFFKGILLPLCESGTCTLREAAIIGSVITKVSIPILHSSAALMKLADMDYTGNINLTVLFFFFMKLYITLLLNTFFENNIIIKKLIIFVEYLLQTLQVQIVYLFVFF